MVISNVIVLGGAGQVGRNAVEYALSAPGYSSVIEYGRRFLPGNPSPKRQTQTCDFEHLDASAIQRSEVDVILVALGTNRKNAGSAEAFKKIDQDYVVDFPRTARIANKRQTLVYCSSWGADPASSGLYLKNKGQTEQRLSQLGFDTIICRPAYLTDVNRPRKPYEFIAPPLMSILKLFGMSSTISVAQVGRAMGKAGVLGREGLQKLGLGESQGGI